MKELSIEEKAKRYDEVYKKVALRFGSNVADEIFFKESEDERIRKKLIEVLFLNIKGAESQMQNCSGVDRTFEIEACKKGIAWLGKQGEHANFRDSIQVGDKVTRNQDGILVNLSQLNRVAKKDEKQGEQKPIIEMKSAEESLGIDSDTYNKIVDECIYGEQKPAWSEEDKNMLQSILDEYKSMPTEKRNWLKSLKDRCTWKPSYEQMKALEHAINCYSGISPTNTEEVYTLEIMKEQLKKLREE